MKRSNLLKAGMLAGLLLVIAVQVHAADPDTLYIRHIEGNVELVETGSSQWMAAAVNTPLIEGDTFRTAAAGRAELFMKDGSLVRIGKNSTMKIIAVEQNGVQFKLDRGTTYINAKGSKEVPIFFDTPSAALDVTTPATFRVDAYDDGTTEVSVYKGMVYAAQQKGKMPVKAGERVVLRADGSAPVLAGLRGVDEWQKWNVDRDIATLQDYSAGGSYAYLPDELRAYSSDLDNNGQWVYTEEYSYVWVPTVITVSTWSPYRVGRWDWVRDSYVWIGCEPWGWAPYHYGRWAYHRNAGWCWVPPARGNVRWAPAHVAWVHSSDRVGWVPLAPGENYDRRKAPVIHQTNVYNAYRNVTIEKSVSATKTVHKNAGVSNSVVTMDRNQLLSQKAVKVNVARTGAASLKKVNLPPNVVPARTKNMQPRVADPGKMPQKETVARQKPLEQSRTNGIATKNDLRTTGKIDEKRPVLQRPAVSAVRDANTRGVTSGQSKVPSVQTQRTTAIPNNTAIKGKEAPMNTQGPKTAISMKDRIDNARKADVKAGQQGGRVQPALNVPPDRKLGENKQQKQIVSRPLQERTSNVQPAVTKRGPQPVSQAPAVILPDRTNRPNTTNNNVKTGQVTPQRPAVQERPPVVTTRPVQDAQRPVQPVVRAPEPVRQAPLRNEAKPAPARRENPVPPRAEPVRQGPPKENAGTTVSSPATPPAPAAVSPKDSGDRRGNSKPPEAEKDNKPQFQRNAAKR